ncbi:DNA-formamidopyrimidine glycosylase [Enterococcus sp. BWR-S5]|uniref:DNA-formamidopyrimidine glycosylase n=1 Tax=Enterococcus sp. BWR-S5 TaxID=2787714 RepID=UPI001924CCA9|nr:DNA-formamidopyrimidine glycosylase [Enterococcus sp. BWR-S5]MBL1224988.1 DNA-formamidopyrimidine glycosylase [Enterococcus sp. BWR-S5]
MPELPEVETVRKGLEKLVVGKEIAAVEVLWGRIIEQPEKELFELSLVGQTIEKMERRGKFLIFKLTDFDMVSHLRMEGKYEFHESKNDPVMKHTHVRFAFTDDTELRYLDVRKFGRMVLVEKDTSNDYKGILSLGPEPVPEKFLLKPFQAGLKKHHKAIKPLLLDQKLVTGLGNIYVDEALWEAKIHPEQPANTLTKKETELLYQAIIDVLARAVEAGGTTIRSYLNALGEAGKFQISLHAYGQTGEPCLRCGTPIQKIKVAQRGTHFCPNCQRVKARRSK